MFSHVMVGSNDIDRSKRFYDAVLGTLGAGEAFRGQAPSGHTRLLYRHEARRRIDRRAAGLARQRLGTDVSGVCARS
jgi:catechol 2,3-dioxygenase-like lactoylglutathione lyase family enzyme